VEKYIKISNVFKLIYNLLRGKSSMFQSLTGSFSIILLVALFGSGTVLSAGEDSHGYMRPFGPRAPWNIPVAGLPRHPESNSYSQLLWNAASDRPGNINLSFDQYTYPVYSADQATGLFPVSTGYTTNINKTQIPWNPAWQAATGSDGQVIVLDSATGREWDLWQVSFNGTTVSATNGSLVAGSYWTKEDGNPPSRGCGIEYLAMLVRPEEIMQGQIRHALSMPIRNTDGNLYVAPATKLEHPGSGSGIPEGMRFALDISDQEIETWIASLPSDLPAATRTSARIIARTLREYGWFITDTSRGAHLQFEDRITAGQKWANLGLDERKVNWKEYPRDLLDGLLRPERIYAIVPSDQYSLHHPNRNNRRIIRRQP
jgi:hypothetical protein